MAANPGECEPGQECKPKILPELQSERRLATKCAGAASRYESPASPFGEQLTEVPGKPGTRVVPRDLTRP